MSTIRVDNFGPSAGGTTYSAGGVAKAWVNFNGTGTIAARDSENVSSLTDNGTGNYTVNFSNAFGAADYSIVTDCKELDNTNTTTVFAMIGPNLTIANSYTANFTRIATRSGTSSYDSVIITATVFGDLA
jgi:hypothetical protein